MGCGPGPSGRVRWRPSGAHGAGLIPHAPGQADRAHRSKASNGPPGSRVGGRGSWTWSWPPLGCREVVAGAHAQAAALGTMWGAQSLQAKVATPIPMGHRPPPWSGWWPVQLSTVSPSSSQSSPGSASLRAEGSSSAHTRGSPRPAVLRWDSWPPQPAVPGLLLAQAGGSRQVQGRASSARTLLRINFFTKCKPNTFPTMN